MCWGLLKASLGDPVYDTMQNCKMSILFENLATILAPCEVRKIQLKNVVSDCDHPKV